MAGKEVLVDLESDGSDFIVGLNQSRFDAYPGNRLKDINFQSLSEMLPPGTLQDALMSYEFPTGLSLQELSTTESARMDQQIKKLIPLAQSYLKTGEIDRDLFEEAAYQLKVIFGKVEVPEPFQNLSIEEIKDRILNQYLVFNDSDRQVSILGMHNVNEYFVPGREIVYRLNPEAQLERLEIYEFYWAEVSQDSDYTYLVTRGDVSGCNIDTIYPIPFNLQNIQASTPRSKHFNRSSVNVTAVMDNQGEVHDLMASNESYVRDLSFFDPNFKLVERRIISCHATVDSNLIVQVLHKPFTSDANIWEGKTDILITDQDNSSKYMQKSLKTENLMNTSRYEIFARYVDEPYVQEIN